MTDIEKKLHKGIGAAIKTCEEYESLPKIHGWVARNDLLYNDGRLMLFNTKPSRDGNYGWRGDYICSLDEPYFHAISWLDEPVEVELLIRITE